jgi:GT2 family glycosyltransferase
MRVSIVIPTYDRLSVLRRVVAAVKRQQRPEDLEIEIVIVDDGSSDDTADWLNTQSEDTALRCIRQPNSGPAKARNRGVEEAAGEIVIFLGDDTEPQPGWLMAHLEEHRLHGCGDKLAVLGYTTFPKEIDSPFLRFINEHGAQFGYLLIEDPGSVGFNFFYTSNISLSRKEFVRLGGFREDFPAAAWEDIEFAYRAVSDGLRIRYQPRARTVHHHCIRPRTFCRRQRTSGRSAAIFASLHPELEEFLGISRCTRATIGGPLRRAVLWLWVEFGERVPGFVPATIYRDFVDLCYLEGLADGLHST